MSWEWYNNDDDDAAADNTLITFSFCFNAKKVMTKSALNALPDGDNCWSRVTQSEMMWDKSEILS